MAELEYIQYVTTYKFTAFTSFLDHFEALARMIELSRRSGQLMNSTSYLEDATKACARSAYEPGLNYCKGLMKRWHLNTMYIYLRVFDTYCYNNHQIYNYVLVN